MGLGARPLVCKRTAEEPGQVSGEWLLEAPWSGACDGWRPSTAVQLASIWDAYRYELIVANWAARAVERATVGGFNAWWCGAFASLSFSARLLARIATHGESSFAAR